MRFPILSDGAQRQSNTIPIEKMKQRRGTSLIESIVNCLLGVGIAILGQIIVFPWFGIRISLLDTSLIAGIFTGISIARSYALRRLFEWLRVSKILP
jgi:hypothetical protein